MARYQDLPRSWRQAISYTLVAAAASAVTFAICWGRNVNINYTSTIPEDMSKLSQAYKIIQEYYIGEKDKDAIYDGAIKGMIYGSGDPWGYYMNAEEYKEYKSVNSREYVGIGVTVNTDQPEKGFLIEKVADNSGAQNAGLRAGDYITHVDGVSIIGSSTADAQSKIRGVKGTSVELTILRDGQQLVMDVVRGTVLNPVAEGVMLRDNVGLLTIYQFDVDCAKEAIAAIENLQKKGAKALILDVRCNPGGLKTELVSLLDYLAPGDKLLFHSVDYDGKEEKIYSKGTGLAEQIPIAVLINEQSYSAAEFFAAALQEYGCVTTVGEHTTGKGYYQTDLPLSDGSVIHLSVGKFYTPNGVNLAEAKGIKPMIEIKLSKEQKEALLADELAPESDPQIQAAIETVLRKLN